MARARGAREREEMLALGLVELRALGGAGEVSPLHPDVIVDGDAGQHGDLFATQPLDATIATVRGQAGLLRGDACSSRAEELADLGAWVVVTAEALTVPR
jgi:hypothetical protein